MTIGIGVLCSTQPKPHSPRPDAIVMIADTMGSTDTDSTDDLHKMWIDDDLKLYIVGAGNLDLCGELVVTLENEIKELPTRSHGAISGAINKAYQMHRAQHFQWDIVWNKLQIPLVGNVADANQVKREWQQFHLGIHMLVATFDHTGQAYLYLVGKFADVDKVVHLCEFPGYSVIGTGGGNAQFWLNYRRQVLGQSIRQSAYKAYEAKRMPARAPTGNDKIEIAIVLHDKTFHLSEENPVISGCPVSIPELDAMLRKYGPRKTDDLGHAKPPSVPQRSSGRL